MMNSFTSKSLVLTALSGALLFSASVAEAQTYKGRVELRGTLVQRGQISEMSVNLRASRLTARNGDEITMNAGGFYSRDSAIVTGRYEGSLQRITNEYGNVRRQRQRNRISVSNRTIRFRDGRIRVNRRLRNIDSPGRYRLRGKGTFRVNV